MIASVLVPTLEVVALVAALSTAGAAAACVVWLSLFISGQVD